MSKILLLDTAFSAIPIYNYLIHQKHDVYVMGNRANDALAIKAGNKWINQNYSQVDAVKRIFSDLSFEYIVPGCTDLSLEVCQQVNDSLGTLDSSETYQHIGDKDKFRNLCGKLGIRSPQTVNIDEFPKSGRYIFKPVDAYSGKGITTVDGNDQGSINKADKAAKLASPSQRSLCEEFIEGQLYSYTSFLVNQNVVDSFTVIEGSSSNPFAVDTSYVIYDFPLETLNKLKKDVEAIAQHLQLVDGLFHLQFILSVDTPYFIEATRRCPGDLYSKLIEYSTGYDYAGKFASTYIDEVYETKTTLKNSIVRHTVSSQTTSFYDGLEFTNSSTVKAFYPLLGLGSLMLPNQETRVGILFLEHENTHELYQKLLERNQLILN